MILLFLFLLFPLSEPSYDRYLVARNQDECLLVQDPERQVDLGALLKYALGRGFSSIRIEGGEWVLSGPVSIANRDSLLTIRGDSVTPVLKGNISIAKAANIKLENLVVEGTMDLDETENVQIRSVYFRRGGIRLKGRRCNQPGECTGYHRNLRVEDCTFENSVRGIQAERLEHSVIQGNRFLGDQAAATCEKGVIGIELDGSGEDIDRPLEQGHSKGNRILQNSFEQEFSIGIRVRDSQANTIRDNRFIGSYRAMEFQEGARHNVVSSNYIGYLSQIPVTSACPNPCGIYVGPGSVNNIFLNNFFEQDFELQFLERNRNRTFVIDESGNQNIFRSDFTRISQ